MVFKRGQNIRKETEVSEDYYQMIVADWRNLKNVPTEEITYQLCEKAVCNCGLALKYVPEKFKSLKICIDAISKDGKALEYIPKEFIDSDICEEAVKKDIFACEFIPEEMKENPILRQYRKIFLELNSVAPHRGA